MDSVLRTGTIVEILSELDAGQVRLILSTDVRRALHAFALTANDLPAGIRLVACTWDRLPGITNVIKSVTHSLAEAARAVWPDWYGSVGDYWCNATTASSPKHQTDGSQNTACAVLLPWIAAAKRLCRSEKLPLPKGFANATHAAQLVLALAPQRLIMVLSAADPDPPAESLLALARAAEWFARQTNAGVAVLLPVSVADRNELGSINWSAVVLPEEPHVKEQREERPRLLISPFHGRPHPNSEGEQLLAKRLDGDDELAGLFRFNQSVTTSRGSRFTVDLLWPAGLVVIEVDGYHWHSDKQSFSGDRHRDYELLISGYAVLRVPHDEVLADVELTLEKIRDVVAIRRKVSVTTEGAHE